MVNKQSLTVLFLPWSHGVGFGYVGRALAIAEEMRDAGHTCVFGSDTKEGLVAKSGMQVRRGGTNHGVAVPDMGDRQGDYIPIDDLDTVYGIARYYHPSRIRAHVQEDLAVIEDVQPDVVVMDMSCTAGIAARSKRIPVVSVADSDFLRDAENSWMPWLSPEEASVFPYPSCVRAFNEVLAELDLPSISHVSDLLWGDLTLVASSPELEDKPSPLTERGPLEYVGPVFWDPPWSNAQAVLKDHGKTSAKRIYVTLGHGGKFSGKYLDATLEGCVDDAWATFVSLGFRPPGDSRPLPTGVASGDWTGISVPIAWSDVVINHGGHATVLASLMYGKPSVVIPFMSEQEANGLLFLEEQGAGFVLRRTMPSPGAKRFEYLLRYSGPSEDGSFEPGEVRQALEEVFSTNSYKQRAEELGRLLRDRVEKRSFVDMIGRVA